MQFLEPQCVENKDILKWFKYSFELISRRWLLYTISVLIFFIMVFFTAQTMHGIGRHVPPILTVSVLVVITAFLFFFTLSNFIVLSHSSDQSKNYSLSTLFEAFLPSQKVFLKMAILAVMTGLFFWYSSILMHPEKNLLSSSESIFQMLGENQSLIMFALSEGSVFLYFALIVMFLFRTFFSAPLILFHHLSYSDAQHLSQKALIKNLRVMINALAIWVCLFLLSIKLAPELALLFLPLFGTYMYVSYRHIFWGKDCNEERKEVVHNVVQTKAV